MTVMGSYGSDVSKVMSDLSARLTFSSGLAEEPSRLVRGDGPEQLTAQPFLFCRIYPDGYAKIELVLSV